MLAGEPIELLAPPPAYVSRGGLKLERALDAFDIEVAGRRGLDAGSSTGGFTDALLQHGAASVVAVDVGTHQLHERLRADSRVSLHEQTDIRSVDAKAVDGPFDIVVADLSFISVRLVLTHLVALAEADGHLVLLVKPQFEAQREEASRGKGIISDPEIWRRTLREVQGASSEAGAAMVGLVRSPIRGGTGARGNVEFLAHLRHAAVAPQPAGDAVELVDAVLKEIASTGADQQESS